MLQTVQICRQHDLNDWSGIYKSLDPSILYEYFQENRFSTWGANHDGHCNRMDSLFLLCEFVHMLSHYTLRRTIL